MNSPNAALLTRARDELLDLGYVTAETHADLRMVGISAADLEAYFIRTGV